MDDLTLPGNVERLQLKMAVQLLKKNGCDTITLKELKQQIADGAPANADGTINLLHYTAWLIANVNSLPAKRHDSGTRRNSGG